MSESNTESTTSEPKAEESTTASESASETPKSVEAEKKPRLNLREQFKAFSKFGDTKSDGKLITLSQSDKWMKQAKVIDKSITTTDTAIHFKKFKSLKISLEDYKKFLEDLAKTKKVDLSEIENKLHSSGAPGVHSAVSNTKIDQTVERLTDVSKYTGSHKQRFDETGKGKGVAGRRDDPDKSGYVSGYKDKNTYDKTH